MNERRSPLRFLAPMALVLFAVAFFVVLTGARTSDGGGEGAATATRPAASETEADAQRERGDRSGGEGQRTRARSYRVRPGDTLGVIAERTGLSVERLQELNPDLDPQALATGKRLKLRE
jgi:hypothetical protein